MDFVKICRRALYFRGSFSVCPAYAGMILGGFTPLLNRLSLSRVCGDDPILLGVKTEKATFVPRMRG